MSALCQWTTSCIWFEMKETPNWGYLIAFENNPVQKILQLLRTSKPRATFRFDAVPFQFLRAFEQEPLNRPGAYI
jgi:hypothetical protein